MSASKLRKLKATSKDEIVADIKRVVETNSAGIITRDYYRANGRYSDTGWKFSDLLKAVYSPSIPSSQQTDSSEIDGDTWTVTLSETDISSLDELIASYKVDTTVWQADKFTYNKLKNGPTVRATFKRRKDLYAAKKEIAALIAEAKVYSRQPTTITRSTELSGNMLELLIPDLHAGKLAWARETGYQNYDTHIAVQTYNRAVESLLGRAADIKLDRILLGVGNDLLNSDNYDNETTKGTRVSTDGRYPKTYTTVRKMMVNTIERLREVAPVTVKMVPGNHDAQTTFTLGDSLECWFHNYDDVEIDNEPILHKFQVWGDVFLMLLHGEKGKHADYGIRMATERPKEFGNTKFREAHIGHKHGVKVEEKFGVRVRTFSALCPPDSWHSGEGHVGNLRVAEGLVWNKKAGLTAQLYHTEID